MENAACGGPLCEGANEIDDADVDFLTADPLHEGAAGGTAEDESERLAVGGRPFGDDSARMRPSWTASWSGSTAMAWAMSIR
ncbi:MAG: hypothetical protein ACSLE8_17005 [Rhodococcus sp. (in: high G+C Gram-positive bacteria)]